MHANLQALRERNLQQKLAELEAEILAQELAKLPPQPAQEPLDPELANLTLEEKLNRMVARHKQMHGVWNSRAIPQAGYYERKELRQKPGWRKEIYSAIVGPPLKEPWEE
jgi:hypothetical protein